MALTLFLSYTYRLLCGVLQQDSFCEQENHPRADTAEGAATFEAEGRAGESDPLYLPPRGRKGPHQKANAEDTRHLTSTMSILPLQHG